MQEFQTAVTAIRQHTPLEPRVGLILGSGLNALAESVENAVSIPFEDIPYFPVSTVEGHAGRLVLGMLEGVPMVVMQGRAHYYEGYSMSRIGLPIRVMRLLGVEWLIVTNAAGGLNMAYRAGDVMVIRDHINLIGMAGLNPLRGPNLAEFGPRFPSMNEAYAPSLRKAAQEIALQAGIPAHQGVYICLAGPSFETPSDVRFLRLIGADAVGMSTVPEVIAARHSGMRVLGLSGISNTLIGEEGAPPPNHEEVLAAGRIVVPRLETIIRGVLHTP
ncbi:MAG TPA: purine-nucleoside phosphorylase [Anaerolineae bacterium]|nr:purine-nucleoside phosphorylase [Anaerolineae bacterium]HQH38753.1 purine-nucleoside phosphorylase [Anaerolineae bacterium]